MPLIGEILSGNVNLPLSIFATRVQRESNSSGSSTPCIETAITFIQPGLGVSRHARLAGHRKMRADRVLRQLKALRVFCATEKETA